MSKRNIQPLPDEPPPRKKLFISHSHREPQVAKAFDLLVTNAIEGLRDEDVGRTSGDADSGLPPGCYITPQLIEDIRTCTVFVGLVSPAYLESPYCLMEYSAWLGAHRGVFPIPFAFPGVQPDDMPGMLSGAKLVALERENEVLAALNIIAKRGVREGWTLRERSRFIRECKTLIRTVKTEQPRPHLARQFTIDVGGTAFLNAYGLKRSARTSGVFRDFSTWREENPIQLMWADSRSDSWIRCNWMKKEKLLRVHFNHAEGSWGCNFSIRPGNDEAVLCGKRRRLRIRARVAPKSALDSVGLIVRVVDGYMQHWRLMEDRLNPKHLTVTKKYEDLSVSLNQSCWCNFPHDGTVANPSEKPDFSIIASVNFALGRPQKDGRGPILAGCGLLDIRKVWLE